MSALANLAGLYEPVKKDIWDPAINWQPIPVHTQPENMDAVRVLHTNKICYTYFLLLNVTVNTYILKFSPFLF